MPDYKKEAKTESNISLRSVQETITRRTARLYTDLSLMTANDQIGMDAARVFQALTKGETVEESEHLLVAPEMPAVTDYRYDQ